MFGRYAELQSRISTLESQIMTLSSALANTLRAIEILDKRVAELENKNKEK